MSCGINDKLIFMIFKEEKMNDKQVTVLSQNKMCLQYVALHCIMNHVVLLLIRKQQIYMHLNRS